MSSYRDLDIYNISLELFYSVHPASLKLPKHELYELGSQLCCPWGKNVLRYRCKVKTTESHSYPIPISEPTPTQTSNLFISK
jgi:hypothetical protein